MSRLEIILSAILLVSIVFNIGIFVYARAAIARLLSVSEELGDLQQMVNSFANHLQSIHELEMFYGDETIKHLVEHAVSFNEQLDTFEYIYSLTQTEEGKIVDDEQENKET
jgi:hypothetical protein|tara:strand:- start:1408 stop:1740 length:333 start_codon:yes stop_codon:yes gene_type:complete